jgi:CRP/FNR family transcriptional regulator, cyclic AMP receptor protein
VPVAPNIEQIKNIEYLSGLRPDGLESVKRYFQVKNLKKGEIFVREGERSNLIYFVSSGLVKVYNTSPDGKEQVLNLASPGETLNDVSAFDDGMDVASMRAMTPAVLYCVGKDDLKSIIVNNPGIALNALRVMARRTRRASKLVEGLSFSQAIGRLARLLQRYSDEKISEHLSLTQQDLASMIGTSREMVNKSLKTLEEKHLVKLSRLHVEIINIDGLKEIARTMPDDRTKNEPGL